jgi:hypothetical protein
LTALGGVYAAVVVTAADPRSRGRVRVQVPGVSGTAVTGWVEPAVAGGRLPVVREPVWVLYQQGDVSYPLYLPSLPRPELPKVTYQLSEPSYSTLLTWVDFTTGQWPRITMTVPGSGMLAVTVSGRVRNINTATSTAGLNYRITGDATRAVADTLALSGRSDRLQASRRQLLTGLPAGGSVTVIPMWRVSSYASGDTEVSGGDLTVEPIGA